jgi:hypothetical protein
LSDNAGPEMSDWDFHLIEYWDQRTGAIHRNARRLHRLGEPERAAACRQIQEAVSRRLHALTDSQLLQAAVSMVDDLYKLVNAEVLLDEALLAYLDAFARTFTTAVRARGYVIQYVVENQYAGVDFLMRGPLDLFPTVFNAAGFVYVCPHQLAWRLMAADGVAAAEYARAFALYIAEARGVGDRLEQCQATGRHFVFLEADYEEGALAAALQGAAAPGVLSVFRNDAPLPGSTVSVSFPSEKLPYAAPTSSATVRVQA